MRKPFKLHSPPFFLIFCNYYLKIRDKKKIKSFSKAIQLERKINISKSDESQLYRQIFEKNKRIYLNRGLLAYIV